jgi:hypothetical protein
MPRRDGVVPTQACMRTLLTNSVKEYASFLKTCTATQVTVTDCNTVKNDARFRRPPLFAVDLAVDDGAFTYSSPLDSFVTVPLERFNDLMAQTQSITRVERVVMRNLFWSFEPVMKSVHPSEDWARRAASRHVTRVHRTMPGVVSFSSLRPFGPLRGRCGV